MTDRVSTGITQLQVGNHRYQKVEIRPADVDATNVGAWEGNFIEYYPTEDDVFHTAKVVFDVLGCTPTYTTPAIPAAQKYYIGKEDLIVAIVGGEHGNCEFGVTLVIHRKDDPADLLPEAAYTL